LSEVAPAIYRIALALWLGGMAVFSLVVTPVIFRSEPRDTAARIVGALMPAYFRFGLAMVSAALAARIAAGRAFGGMQPSFGTLLLGAAVAVQFWQAFLMLPRMERIKARIPSFGEGDLHHPARREFGRLHALSMTLNFLLMTLAALLIAGQDSFAP